MIDPLIMAGKCMLELHIFLSGPMGFATFWEVRRCQQYCSMTLEAGRFFH